MAITGAVTIGIDTGVTPITAITAPGIVATTAIIDLAPHRARSRMIEFVRIPWTGIYRTGPARPQPAAFVDGLMAAASRDAFKSAGL
jgi:hypothetical protein